MLGYHELFKRNKEKLKKRRQEIIGNRKRGDTGVYIPTDLMAKEEM